MIPRSRKRKSYTFEDALKVEGTIHRLNYNVTRFLKLTGKTNIWCLCALKSHDPLMKMDATGLKSWRVIGFRAALDETKTCHTPCPFR